MMGKPVSAALKIYSDNFTNGFLILPCVRHGDGYAILNQFHLKFPAKDIVEGFIDNQGNFFDRKEACSEWWWFLSASTRELKIQENSTNELYSEDLY